jgi:subtilisin family serine protease
MATPHVAGMAVLTFGAHPDLKDAALKARLLDSVDEKFNLSGKTVTGGRLNAACALGTQEPQPADGPPEVSGTTPGDGARRVRRANAVTATVSEEMDADTINGATVTLRTLARGRRLGRR